MDQLIQQSKVIICMGTGGVGKTTVSAGIAVRAAEIGYKVLVLTVDPAQRLSSALGINERPKEDILVPNQKFKGQMYAALIDSKYVFDKFIKETAPTEAAYKKILENRIYQELSTTLNGSQEFTSLQRLYESVYNAQYDLVVLDTPPAEHAIEFIQSPRKIFNLFEESVLKWFLAPFEKQSFFNQIFHSSSKIAFKALEILTGSEFLNHIFDFFLSIHAYRHILQNRAQSVEAILKHETTSYVLITGYDPVKIQEAKNIQSRMKLEKLHFNAVIVNRAFPFINLSEDLGQETHFKATELIDYYKKLRSHYSLYEKAIDDLKNKFGDNIEFLRIPDFDQEVYEINNLQKISQFFKEGSAP